VCQRKRRKIVHREPDLVTIAAGLSLTARRAEANTCVVDQDVEAIVCRSDLVGQTPHLIERREIGAKVSSTSTTVRSLSGTAAALPVVVLATFQFYLSFLCNDIDHRLRNPIPTDDLVIEDSYAT
jgi:hypothetical protein